MNKTISIMYFFCLLPYSESVLQRHSSGKTALSDVTRGTDTSFSSVTHSQSCVCSSTA